LEKKKKQREGNGSYIHVAQQKLGLPPEHFGGRDDGGAIEGKRAAGC